MMDLELIEQLVTRILSEGLGLDVTDPNLRGTPGRISKMWVTEFFETLGEGKGFDNLTTFPNEPGYNQLIMLDRIHFTSMCSHHFLPFSGLAWVAYIPDEKLIGASKPSRLISYHSKKPQIQESLCHEVIHDFDRIVEPRGTMVLMRGIHGCMSNRGVLQYNGSGMTTSAVSGSINEDGKTRTEALDLIKISLLMHSL